MPLALGNIRVNIALCDAVSHTRACSTRQSGLCLAEAPGVNGKCRSTLPTEPVLFGEAASDDSIEKITSTEGPSQISSFNDDDDTMPHEIRVGPNPLSIEPPKWAVAAKGKARLEPVCEAVGSHPKVDLTRSPCIRVGRSPTSDLQLLHRTSSRRHALLFHHPNGSCYIVDCGSAHGTYVNGVRISSTHVCGRVVPHRVRRGALIRFGGPGAPAFVLKSHAVGFSHLIPDLEEDKKETLPSSHPTLSPTFGVQLTHRLQALRPINRSAPPSCVVGGILKKRSFDLEEDEVVQPDRKRARCESPDAQPGSPLRLVSPDLQQQQSAATTTRRVTFDDRLVRAVTYTTSSEESGDEE